MVDNSEYEKDLAEVASSNYTRLSSIELAVKFKFEEFYQGFLKLSNGMKRLYYRWDFDWLCRENNLSYSWVELSSDEVNLLNKYENNLCSGDVEYSVKANGDIAWLWLKRNKAPGSAKRLNYIQDFLLWQAYERNDLVLDEPKRGPKESERKFNERRVKYNRDVERIKNTRVNLYKNFCYSYLKYYVEQQSKFPGNEYDFYDGETNRAILVLRGLNIKLHFIHSPSEEEPRTSSLNELKEILEHLGGNITVQTDDFVGYRGQADASWVLDSSLTRTKKYVSKEREMYYEVMNTSPAQFSKDSTLFEKLIRLQHYSLPTRLMDITRNPLVAIYFACCNLDRASADGAIYSFAVEKDEVLNYDDKTLSCFAKRVLCEDGKLPCDSCDDEENCFHKVKFQENFIVNGFLSNPRIDNQKGDFLFVNESDHEKLYKFVDGIIVIESGLKSILIEKLESLNIHAGTLFPDLANLNSYICKKYER